MKRKKEKAKSQLKSNNNLFSLMQVRVVLVYEVDPTYIQKERGIISEDIHWKYAEGYLSAN